MSETTQDFTDFARQLGDAWTNASAVPPPSATYPDLTREDAYSIQEWIIAARLDATRSRAGWKLGLTTAQPPETPIVGTLLSDMVIPTPAELSLSGLVSPKVEAEVVVLIGETIDGPRSLEDLAHGPHQVGPGIEVIDYRTVGESRIADWIADNSTTAYAVVGEFVPLAGVDLAALEASISGDDRQLGAGAGRLVMGNPLAAVAWLTEHMARRGQTLEQGQIVLTGTLTGAHSVPPNRLSTFNADFGQLGNVSVTFQA